MKFKLIAIAIVVVFLLVLTILFAGRPANNGGDQVIDNGADTVTQ